MLGVFKETLFSQVNLLLQDLVLLQLLERLKIGWSREYWGWGEYGTSIESIDVAVTGLPTSLTITSVTVTAEVNAGWGSGTWGEDGWGIAR